MADEVSYRLVASVTKDDISERFDKSFTADMAGNYVEAGIQNVGTTHEVLNLGDVTSPGAIIFQNLDPDNFVTIGRVIAAAFEPWGDVFPGEFGGPIRPSSGVTWYVKADTAAVPLKRFIPST